MSGGRRRGRGRSAEEVISSRSTEGVPRHEPGGGALRRHRGGGGALEPHSEGEDA